MLGITASGITEIGNLSVVAPGMVCAVFVFWSCRAQRMAAALAIEFLVVFVVTVVLKAVSDRIGGAFDGTLFHLSHAAPSGHMAVAMAGYGGLGVIWLSRKASALRLMAPLMAVAAIVVVGVTRVLVHAHTPADVISAVVVAALPLVWLARVTADPPVEIDLPLWLATLALVLVAVICFVLGIRFSSSMIF